MTPEPRYSTVRFTLQYGKYFVPVGALLPLLAAALLTWPQWSWPAAIVAIIAGAIVGFMVQSYLEILRIIADTLLPR